MVLAKSQLGRGLFPARLIVDKSLRHSSYSASNWFGSIKSASRRRDL